MKATLLPELWRTHERQIFAYCYRLLGETAAAEDAAQETFLRVQHHVDRIPDTRNEALAWMRRVALNYCRNELRSRRRRPEPQGELPELRDGSVRPDLCRFDRAEDHLADRQLVRTLIEHSAPPLRNVALLYHVAGRGQQEVADMLGISRRTVVERLAKFAAMSRHRLAAPRDKRLWTR